MEEPPGQQRTSLTSEIIGIEISYRIPFINFTKIKNCLAKKFIMRYKEITLDSCRSFCIKKICHRGWEIQKALVYY